MVARIDITKSIIDLLPDDQKVTLEKASITWYKNIRSTGGLRLTDRGYEVCCGVGLQSHTVPFTEKKVSKSSMLELDRKLEFPYYINTRRNELVLFSSREAMMATLYGNIIMWLESLQPR